VPGDWRKANATPVFKKGKKEDPGNYRTVRLTSIPGKVNSSFWMSSLSKCRKRRLSGVVNMDSPRANHA